MTVQYSIQKMVSDGTLSTIALGIQYLQRNDIYIRIAGEETPQSGATSGYTWSFINNTTLKILPVVPNGVEVVVYRRTDVDAMYNIYSQNAQFDEATIDENNQQLLYIAQEYLEQGIPGAGVDIIEFIRDDGSFTYYRIKRTDGSYSDEFYVPSACSSTKVLARESLRRSYAEAGYDLIGTSSNTGLVVDDAADVVLWEPTGVAYAYSGALPHTIGAGWTPVGNPLWVPKAGVTLRDALSVVISKSVNISSLGLSDTDAIFNATQLNSKLIELQSQGINTIYVDKSYAIDTGYNYSTGMYTRRVSRIPEFNWVDAGGVVTGLYGFQLQTLHEPTYSANNGSDFKVKGQHADSNLVVVMMGDSISAEWADSLANGINQWEVIKSEISRQNPGKTISFFNLSIGGQTWAQANTKPTFFPNWYIDTGLDWVYYVVLPKPDIVIFGFGMNDATGFNMGTMVSTINKVKGALPNVHMCMITCMVPSRSSDYASGHGFDGLIHQEGRNFAAGAERTYAEFYGLSVLDLNRAEVAWRDGKDLVACEMTEVPATPVSGVYRADPCVDFSFECKISGWDRTTPIHVNCGGDEEDLIYIGEDTGNFVVAGRTEYINTYYFSGRTAVFIPTVDFYLTVSVMNNQASVYLSNGPAPINDIGNILVASFRVIRHGGIVRPAIGTGGLVTGNVAALRVMLGQPKQVRKELTDTDIWGLGDASPSRKSPYGGNGINHPSGQGLAQLIKPVMEAQDFRIKLQDFTLTGVYASGATDWQSGYPPKITYMAQDNIIIFSGGLKRSGSVPAIVFTIPDYGRLAAPIDKVFQASGVGANTLWAPQMFRLDTAGNVWHEAGDITNGCTLEGATVKVK